MSKLNALILMGRGLRHRYFANQVADIFDVAELDRLNILTR